MTQNSCALHLPREPVSQPPSIVADDVSIDLLEIAADASVRREALSILVVDDDEMICRAVSRLLKRTCDRVYTACSAAEARSILRAHRVDFLLCDFDLDSNECDGATLTTQLRMQFPKIRHAVIFSGELPGQIPPCSAADAIWSKKSAISNLSERIETVSRSWG